MMIILIIIILTVLAVLFYAIIAIDDSSIRGMFLILYSILFCLLTGIIFDYGNENSINCPTALDVYRGKTDLQINKTVKNDSILIKCDSVVVYKN